MNHTTGPWKKSTIKTGYLIKSKSGCLIAQVPQYPGGTGAPECEPNAQLISHAPELLDRLRAARAVIPSGNEALVISIDSAIKKATAV